MYACLHLVTSGDWQTIIHKHHHLASNDIQSIVKSKPINTENIQESDRARGGSELLRGLCYRHWRIRLRHRFRSSLPTDERKSKTTIPDLLIRGGGKVRNLVWNWDVMHMNASATLQRRSSRHSSHVPTIKFSPTKQENKSRSRQEIGRITASRRKRISFGRKKKGTTRMRIGD